MPATDRAKAILEEVAAYYASLTSYSDRGAVDRQFDASDPAHRTSFSTRFRRPALFRFEFERPHAYPPLRHIIHRHIAGFDGIGAYNWSQMHTNTARISLPGSLSLAIAGATGISSGSAHTVGKLLMPEIAGRSFLELIDQHQEADSLVEGIACWSLAARYPTGSRVQLRIEKDTLLVRQVITTREADQYPSTEQRDDIRINEPIDDTVFARPT